MFRVSSRLVHLKLNFLFAKLELFDFQALTVLKSSPGTTQIVCYGFLRNTPALEKNESPKQNGVPQRGEHVFY